MKLTHIAQTILTKRYLRLKEDGSRETPAEMLRRVARVVAGAEAARGAPTEEVRATEEQFFRLMDRQDFMPNSPTLTGAGTQLGLLSACFVLPIGDSLPEIYETLKNDALIHQAGGGTGHAFSRLRPQGAPVRSSQGVASGPVSFLRVYNHSTEAIKQGGTRRGANMGILRVDHPDILEFIDCKTVPGEIANFNISVAITDAFMEALANDAEYDLIDPRDGKVVGKLSARLVWTKLVENAWKNGEPGVFFIDRANRRNPNGDGRVPVWVRPDGTGVDAAGAPVKELIEATNPCGEQPLPPYGSCNLGSINLANFVKHPYTDQAVVDWERLEEVTRLAVRFLDNVIDVNRFPLPQIAEKALRDRRIGLGVMGWAEMLVQMSLPYDSEEAVALGRQVMTFIKRKAMEASMKLAEERGPFPEWEGSLWHKAGIKVRNATLTTVAPTGTISILAAQSEHPHHRLPDGTVLGMPCSGGIEPKFALVITRNQAGEQMLDVDGQLLFIARRDGWYSDELMERLAERGTVRGLEGVPERWQRIFATAHDIAPEWHVRMQAAFQGEDALPVDEQPVDAAVSKTVNLPHNATVADVDRVYRLAWQLGLKGITVYRDGSRSGQVLTAGTGKVEEKPPAPAPVLRPRPSEADGKMFIVPTHFGKLTLDVHLDEKGEPFEVICNVGAVGSDLMADAVGMGMLVSKMLRLRSDVPVMERINIVIDTLKNIGGSGSYGFGPNRVRSLASAIAVGLQRFVDQRNGTVRDSVEAAVPWMGGQKVDRFEVCPRCGSHALAMVEGCGTCLNCGESLCS